LLGASLFLEKDIMRSTLASLAFAVVVVTPLAALAQPGTVPATTTTSVDGIKIHSATADSTRTAEIGRVGNAEALNTARQAPSKTVGLILPRKGDHDNAD
jgi:hypothetical protein